MAEAKFKVGDKVRVISVPRDGAHFRIGTELKVAGVERPNAHFTYSFDGMAYWATLTEQRLELVEAKVVVPPADWSKVPELAKLVADKAMELADEHGWCSVVHDALEEMGLKEYIKETKEFRLDVTVRLEAGVSDKDFHEAIRALVAKDERFTLDDFYEN